MKTLICFIQKRLSSFRYAFQGVKLLLFKEVNFKIQCCIALLAVVLGFVFELSYIEWALQLLAIGMVLVAEGLNTSIEKLADFVYDKQHSKIAAVKDIAAGASLLASFLALIIGLVLYLPKLL